MKIYVMGIEEASMEPIFRSFEVDEKLSGKELLWQADELFSEEIDEEDVLIRFDKVKNTSFGVIGIGRLNQYRGKFAVLAVSYGNISHLKDEFFESISDYDDSVKGYVTGRDLMYWFYEHTK